MTTQIAGWRADALIERVATLAEENPAEYGGFLARLQRAGRDALEGAIALHSENKELYWLLGDFLQGGAGAEGSLHDSGSFRPDAADILIAAVKAAIERFERLDPSSAQRDDDPEAA